MTDIKWVDNHIEIEPPKKTKKITGTRFASILGLNVWSTPFQMWCEVTKTYEKPFEDTIYTIAGKTIEPKQAEYMKRSYGMDLISPTDRYGANYFQKTWGDFFPENEVLGGMWDFLGVDENGDVDTVLEMKTTKRIEDWQNDIPEYYALQAALYAYLLGVDNVIMVASFLEEEDYKHPENYVPSVNNTITREFKVSERYPDMADRIEAVIDWWETYVKTGKSPDYDIKRDADIIKVLSTCSISPFSDKEDIIAEAENLKAEIDEHNKAIADKEKKYKEIINMIKADCMDNLNDYKYVEVAGKKYVWTLAKSEKTSVDEAALKRDGLYDKYLKTSESYRMTVKEIEACT